MSEHRQPVPERTTVGKVNGKLVSAASDEHSLWVELTGPKRGGAIQWSPDRARDLASLLNSAADLAEALYR